MCNFHRKTCSETESMRSLVIILCYVTVALSVSLSGQRHLFPHNISKKKKWTSIIWKLGIWLPLRPLRMPILIFGIVAVQGHRGPIGKIWFPEGNSKCFRSIHLKLGTHTCPDRFRCLLICDGHLQFWSH